MAKKCALTFAAVLVMLVAMPRVGRAADGPVYYVSLGDSAAAGFQPTGWNSFGYADQLADRVRTTTPELRLVKLGCPGETTASLISGKNSPCNYAAGSQLSQAKRVLGAHPGKVVFITINVGVNDVLDVCLNPETLELKKACVDRVLPPALANLTKILTALRQAAPGVPIAGMSYWNPFLGLWVIAGPDGEALARESDRAMRALNAGLVSTYREGAAVVAYVGGPAYFNIADFDTQVSTRWGRLPDNVAKACRWTFFCDEQARTDPHPNTKGYGVITDAFAAALGV